MLENGLRVVNIWDPNTTQARAEAVQSRGACFCCLGSPVFPGDWGLLRSVNVAVCFMIFKVSEGCSTDAASCLLGNAFNFAGQDVLHFETMVPKFHVSALITPRGNVLIDPKLKLK